MSPDTDFDPNREPPPYAEDLTQDLQLAPLLDAMAAGDTFIREMCEAALLAGCTDTEEIAHRHAVLADCDRHREVIVELYQLATAILEDRRRIHRTSLYFGAESRLHMSINVLAACLPALTRLRDLSDSEAPSFASEAFGRFFDTVRHDLDYPYLATVEQELGQLRLTRGMLLNAALGEGNTGVDFVLRTPDETKRTFFHRVPLVRPTRSFVIPDRDEASFNALRALRDDALDDASAAAGESVSHVIDFFTVLRRELAFYLGCLNLADALRALGHQVCVPTLGPSDSTRHVGQAVYDASLALDNRTTAVPSDLDNTDAPVVLITGANRGGKSTFLRAVGIAALLARCGCYASASGYEVPLYREVITHFRREEDVELASGKFDEELTRMAIVADQLRSGSLLLSNESFSSTNEREGSQIAEEVLRGLADAGVQIVMVTHMFELAELMRTGATATRFLRAERREGGERSFRILPGAPSETSYAMDLYRRMFEHEAPRPTDGRRPSGEMATAAAGDVAPTGDVAPAPAGEVAPPSGVVGR
jgi:hypothetical protein